MTARDPPPVTPPPVTRPPVVRPVTPPPVTGPPRARARALAVPGGGQHVLAVPLALRLAARIQERPLDGYFSDPTQLANGLRRLPAGRGADGLVITDPDALGEDVAAAEPGSAGRRAAGVGRAGGGPEAARHRQPTPRSSSPGCRARRPSPRSGRAGATRPRSSGCWRRSSSAPGST